MATAWTGHDDSALLRHFLGSEGRPLLAEGTPSTKDRFLQLSVRSHDPLEGQQRIALAVRHAVQECRLFADTVEKAVKYSLVGKLAVVLERLEGFF
jgi:hypothetical protein